jgi:hypothetical protein
MKLFIYDLLTEDSFASGKRPDSKPIYYTLGPTSQRAAGGGGRADSRRASVRPNYRQFAMGERGQVLETAFTSTIARGLRILLSPCCRSYICEAEKPSASSSDFATVNWPQHAG